MRIGRVDSSLAILALTVAYVSCNSAELLCVSCTDWWYHLALVVGSSLGTYV